MIEPETIERTKAEPEGKLWVKDAELIRRMGVPEKIARATIRELDKRPAVTGFPQKSKLWGDRRYWPAVKAWLDKTNGVRMEPPRRHHHDRLSARS